MPNSYIYLDYVANTPVDKEVLKTFDETTLKYFANPNSTHSLGVEVNKKIEETTKKYIGNLKENGYETSLYYARILKLDLNSRK